MDSETKIVEESEGGVISKPVAGQLSPIVIKGYWDRLIEFTPQFL